MRVVFYLSSSFEKWDPLTIEKEGSGASEWMAVQIAERLAARGHVVTVYADPPQPGVVRGVAYRPHEEFGAGPVSDVLVVYRRPEALDLSCLGQTERLIFVTTDKHHQGSISDAQVAMTQRFVVVSEWHKRRFLSVHQNIPERKVLVIPNGVRESGRGRLRDERRLHLLHTSSPDRGLEHAIRAMPAIRAEVPGAVLHVYADFSVPLAFARQEQNAWRIEHLQKLETEVKYVADGSVVFHGRVGRRELEAALKDALVWVYPSTVEETSCVAAMEAQAFGCRVVATRYGALEDTCAGPYCELIEPLGEAGLGEYVAAVVRALRNREPVPPLERDKFSLERALDAYEEVITGRAPELGLPTWGTPIEAPPAEVAAGPLAAIDGNRRNAERLERALEQGDDDKQHLVFLLAEAYRDGALISKARDTYRRRAVMPGGSADEAYEAALSVALLTEKLTDRSDEIVGAHMLAIDLRPLRVEAHLALAQYLRRIGDYEGALALARRAAELPCRGRLSDMAWAEVRSLEGLCATDLAAPSIVEMDVLWAAGWKLVLPKTEMAQSLEDFRVPLGEALVRLASQPSRPLSPVPKSGGEIWFGVHEAGTPEPPPHAIIYQSEVFSSGWFTEKYRERLRRAAEVWDYSTANQAHYEARVKRHVPLRWSPSQVIPKVAVEPAFDFGLVGSRCERRAALEPELQLFTNAPRGTQRDAVERSVKIHVVPHFYEGAPVPQARISRLLASGYCVIAEEAPDQADYPGPVYVPYARLMATARGFVEHELWKEQGLEGQRRFCGTSMVDSLIAAYKKPLPLGSFGGAPSPLRLNLGACDEQSRVAGYVSVDIAEGADVRADLSKPWPWATSTVDEIVATDFIEHLPDKILTMNEAYRVLKPGGIFKIVVPTTDGRGAWQDPTHVSFWNRNSFWYFTDGDPHRERFGERYGIKARFRVTHALRRDGGEEIKFLEITLEAVKAPVNAADQQVVPELDTTRENPSQQLEDVGIRPGSIGEVSERTPVLWVGGKHQFIAMLRVKNEARWLGGVLEALRTVTHEIHVLDDHSTDDTCNIVERAGVDLIRSPFQGLDETRDKNFLLHIIKSKHLEKFRSDTNLWIIGIDGDEELEPGAFQILQKHTDPQATAYSFQVLYLWDKPDQVRVDGVYESFRRYSMFRAVNPGLGFEGTPMRGNLHCKSIPAELIPQGREHPLRLLHYGYLHREDRAQKYVRYNKLDPYNVAEDQYRHIVQGDGLIQVSGMPPDLVATVPREERLKWAGPLKLAPLESVLRR